MAEAPVKLSHTPKPGKYLVAAFQTAGYISLLAVNYLQEKKVVKDIGYFDVKNLNTVAMIEDGELKFPIRILESDSALFVFSHFPIPQEDLEPLTDGIIGLAKKIKAKGIICLDSLNVNETKQTSDVYYVAENFKDVPKDFKQLAEGAMVGVNANLSLKASKNGMKVIVLMAETHASIPDGLAAAALISAMGKLMSLKVDTSELVSEYKQVLSKIQQMVKKAQSMQQKKTPTGSEEEGQPEIYG